MSSVVCRIRIAGVWQKLLSHLRARSGTALKRMEEWYECSLVPVLGGFVLIKSCIDDNSFDVGEPATAPGAMDLLASTPRFCVCP